MAFTELIFKDRQLVGYEAKDGFKALLERGSEINKKKVLINSDKNTQNGITGSADQDSNLEPTPYT